MITRNIYRRLQEEWRQNLRNRQCSTCSNQPATGSCTACGRQQHTVNTEWYSANDKCKRHRKGTPTTSDTKVKAHYRRKPLS